MKNLWKKQLLIISLLLGLLVVCAPVASAALDQEVTQRLELNTATKADLMALGILTETQVDDIISFRQGMGDFLSYEELQDVGLDAATIDALRPYTTINFMATDCSC